MNDDCPLVSRLFFPTRQNETLDNEKGARQNENALEQCSAKYQTRQIEMLEDENGARQNENAPAQCSAKYRTRQIEMFKGARQIEMIA